MIVPTTLHFMPSENMKPWLFAGWVVAVCLVAMALGVTALTHWVVVGFVAIVPATVVSSLWRVPERTMSESIHDARG
jgi:hypothetical protein